MNQTLHVFGPVLIGALLLALPDLALANWWIVRVTRIGRMVYPTREEAEAEVKRLCK